MLLNKTSRNSIKTTVLRLGSILIVSGLVLLLAMQGVADGIGYPLSSTQDLHYQRFYNFSIYTASMFLVVQPALFAIEYACGLYKSNLTTATGGKVSSSKTIMATAYDSAVTPVNLVQKSRATILHTLYGRGASASSWTAPATVSSLASNLGLTNHRVTLELWISIMRNQVLKWQTDLAAMNLTYSGASSSHTAAVIAAVGSSAKYVNTLAKVKNYKDALTNALVLYKKSVPALTAGSQTDSAVQKTVKAIFLAHAGVTTSGKLPTIAAIKTAVADLTTAANAGHLTTVTHVASGFPSTMIGFTYYKVIDTAKWIWFDLIVSSTWGLCQSEVYWAKVHWWDAVFNTHIGLVITTLAGLVGILGMIYQWRIIRSNNEAQDADARLRDITQRVDTTTAAIKADVEGAVETAEADLESAADQTRSWYSLSYLSTRSKILIATVVTVLGLVASFFAGVAIYAGDVTAIIRKKGIETFWNACISLVS